MKFRNERDMYKMGLAIYKQCEQRKSDLDYQELQQKVSVKNNGIITVIYRCQKY